MSAINSAAGVGPAAPQERIETLDILRGWAIFGMIFVNMSVDLGSQGTTDRVAKHLVDFFASGKFGSVFSFLFGLGFALQMRRAEARSGRFIPVYLRRMAILLLIGLIQQLLVGWTILDIYAVLGFLLLLFRSRSTWECNDANYQDECPYPTEVVCTGCAAKGVDQEPSHGRTLDEQK